MRHQASRSGTYPLELHTNRNIPDSALKLQTICIALFSIKADSERKITALIADPHKSSPVIARARNEVGDYFGTASTMLCGAMVGMTLVSL
jgi:hypothetical protein